MPLLPYYHELKTIDELLERDKKREKDGGPLKGLITLSLIEIMVSHPMLGGGGKNLIHICLLANSIIIFRRLNMYIRYDMD